jgi:hypothetical protein
VPTPHHYQVPETLRRAQRWDVIKLRYTDAGLCDPCAGQAAWGHQDHAGGWNDLQPPCDRCEPVIRDFPVATTNPLWRKFQRPEDKKRAAAAPLTLGEAVADTHRHYSGQDAVLL